jgi:hypothetical protein
MNLSLKTNTLLFGVYFGGIISYNIYTIYTNSTTQLLEYRKNKQFFKNELDSVINGSQKNWFDNLLLSLFWPIRLPLKVVPIVVLYFNNNNDNNDEKFIQYEIKKYVNIKNPTDNERIEYIKTVNKIKKDTFESNNEKTETLQIKKDDKIVMKENIDSVKENIKEDNIELIKEIIKEEEPTIKEQFQTTFEFDFNNKDDDEFSFTA